MKKSHQAFTLVELLVVITIIGILVGVALPVFQKAQEKGKAITDLSNLRQLGVAVQLYKNDNNNTILEDPAAGGTSVKNWPEQLYPTYAPTWKVFKSPFEKPERKVTEVAATSPVSYGINDLPGTAGKLIGNDSSKINYPSNLILFAPSLNYGAPGSDPVFNGNVGTSNAVVTPPAVVDKGTHGSRRRINVVYADGHSEDILFAKFKDSASDTGKKLWVYDTP